MPTDKITNDLLVFCPELSDSILSSLTFFGILSRQPQHDLRFCPTFYYQHPPSLLWIGTTTYNHSLIFVSMTFQISFVLMWTSTGLRGKVFIEGYAGLMVWSRLIFWMHLYCYPVYCCRMSILLLLGGVTRFVVTGLSWEVVVVLEEVGGIGPARPVSLSH